MSATHSDSTPLRGDAGVPPAPPETHQQAEPTAGLLATESADAVARASAAERSPACNRPAKSSGASSNGVRSQRAEGDAFPMLRDRLHGAVRVVSAPLLSPTPPALAARIVALARVEIGHRVLEPSAGTGALLAALPGVLPFGVRRHTAVDAVAVEVDADLCRLLRASGLASRVRCEDFLACGQEMGRFDRILMNPPFCGFADIRHIEHALRFLRTGGRLVAVCANGPRQRVRLGELVLRRSGTWEDLPDGTFAYAGTDVRTALIAIDG